MCRNQKLRHALLLWLGWLGGAALAHAHAQDIMQFGREEARRVAPVGPVKGGPPSETLSNALRLYTQEHYDEAAVQLQRVVEGETPDAAANVQKAQFFLGKALYHLRYYQSALAVFDEISEQGKRHTYFDQTLQWLAQLASQLPEPAGIIDKVGRYGAPQLEQFHTPENTDLYNHLLYLMGRSKYNQEEFEAAIALFDKVDKENKWYVKAGFFTGVSYVKLHKAQPAATAFRDIIGVLERGDIKDVDEPARMRDLAWLSLARVYYTAANRTTAQGEHRVDGRLLGNAVEAWNKLEPESEYWPDSLFEASWAFFLADEYSRALGNVHTLSAPYFSNAFYPEAQVLKAVVFFSNCQMDNATASVQQFHERYDSVKSKLDELLSQYRDNTQFYEFLQNIRAGRTDLPKEVRAVVRTALSDRAVLSNLEYVSVLEDEHQRLENSAAQFKGSSLGARVQQDVLVAKSFAIDQAGDIAKARYHRLTDDMQDLANQIDTIEIEVLNYQRGQLSKELQNQQTVAGQSRGGAVFISPEHNVWPFNGEYWRDELGYYRQEVTYKCGR